MMTDGTVRHYDKYVLIHITGKTEAACNDVHVYSVVSTGKTMYIILHNERCGFIEHRLCKCLVLTRHSVHSLLSGCSRRTEGRSINGGSYDSSQPQTPDRFPVRLPAHLSPRLPCPGRGMSSACRETSRTSTDRYTASPWTECLISWRIRLAVGEQAEN